jgi:hypothetical protein
MQKKIISFLFLLMFSAATFQSFSQCAMCRRTAETNQTENTKSGHGLNKGILYLLSIPYVLGGIGLFAWYRNRKKD